MSRILTANNNILRTGNSVLLTGVAQTPALDLDAENIAGAAGSQVSSWADPSRGIQAAQATASARPILQTSGGFKEVVFDGTDDFITLSQLFNAKTIFCVVRAGVVNQGYGSLFGGTLPQWTYTGFGSSYMGADSSIPESFGNASANRIFVNNNRVSPIQNATRNTFYQLLCLDVADRDRDFYTLGCSLNGTTPIFFFNGAFRRIILYNSRLSEIDRQTASQQLITQYSL